MKTLERGIMYSVLFVTLLAILSSSASATETNVINSYFFSGNSFEVNGVSYDITISSGRDNIYLSSDTGYFFIGVGNCEEDTYVKFCYDSAVFDEDDQKYKALIKVSTLSPTVSATHSASSSSLQVGDETEITVVISNTASVAAETVYFTQEIPEGLEVVDTGSGVTVSENIVTWASSVKKEDEKTFSYTLKAVDTNTEPLVSEISYFDGFTTKTVYSNSVTVTATAPYTVTITTNASAYYLGDVLELDIAFQNTAGDEMTVDELSIALPSSMDVTQLDSLLEEDNSQYIYGAVLEDNETETLDITAQLQSVEPMEIVVEGSFTIDDITNTFEKTLTLDVEDRAIPLRPYFVFDVSRKADDDFVLLSDGITLEGNQRGLFELYIDNPYPFDISNVVVRITSDLLNISTEVVPLVSGSKKIISQTFETPSLSSKQKYEFVYNTTYTTDFGYVYKDGFERDLSIEPVDDLTVKHSLSKSKPESGDEVTVTVTVKNGREVDLERIEVEDIVPSELQLAGSRTATLDIDSGETETVYSYTLKLPIVTDDTEYSIITNIAYSDKTREYAFSTNYTLDVYPRSPDVVLRRTLTSRDVTLGEIFAYDYEIENKEDYPITDIVITFPEVDFSYLVDDLVYTVDRLNPNEKRTLSGIEKRVMLFHDDSSQSTGEPLMTFVDDLGSSFEEDGSDVKVSTKTASPSIPLLFFERELITVVGETALYSLLVRNFGETPATFTLYDARESSLTLQPGSSYVSNISREVPLGEIPKAYLSFELGTRTYCAVSDAIPVELDTSEPEEVEDVVDVDEEEDIDVPDVVVDGSDNDTNNIEEKQGLVQRIISFFKGLFT
jgi:uncharacterized repeat protein (TIGR01451 family)